MGFCSLWHIRDRKSTRRGFTEPASFRLQGLVTLLTAYAFRARAGLISYRQRPRDSPFGALPSHEVPERFRPDEPTYRFACRYYRYLSGGPDRQAAVPGL